MTIISLTDNLYHRIQKGRKRNTEMIQDSHYKMQLGLGDREGKRIIKTWKVVLEAKYYI